MKPHPHAAAMAEYAKDAAETETPWERWEHRVDANTDQWEALTRHPIWYQHVQYRRKPRTIQINGFDVPEPIRDRLKYGDRYFTPSIAYGFASFYQVTWRGVADDDQRLEAGLCHAEQSAAEIHAKALLSFTQANPEP